MVAPEGHARVLGQLIEGTRQRAVANNHRKLAPGKLVHPDGHIYEGIFDGDTCVYGLHTKPDGKQEQILTLRGGVYMGETKDNQAHGYGVHTRPPYRYEGWFKNGYPSGQGQSTWQSGSTFTETMLRGVRNGFGVEGARRKPTSSTVPRSLCQVGQVGPGNLDDGLPRGLLAGVIMEVWVAQRLDWACELLRRRGKELS